MNKNLIFSLLLCILMVIAPHAEHLPLQVSLLCAGLLLWRTWLNQSGRPLPKRWLLIPLTLFGIGLNLFTYHTIFGREAGVSLLVLLATFKLMELHKPRDAMVLIYLSCFIIITNFFYSQSIPTALYLFATMLVIVTTWVHLQAESITLKPRLRIAATLLIQAIPLTFILFVLFPRIPGPLWGLPQDAYASSGLDDTMSPGSLSHLSLSEAVAFRVAYNNKVPRRDQMYWRGPVLWYFDGRTWKQGSNFLMIQPEFTDLDQAIDYTVTLEPHNKRWLFALDVPEKLSIPAKLTYDFQILRKEPVNSRMRYTVRSSLKYNANADESPQQIRRALQLPRQFNPRARQLASEWRENNTSDADVVRTALAYFNREKFIYTLEPPALGIDSVDEFLFDTHQGFCEHYASAFVFLMRAANIPARVVTGYLGGEYNDIGNYYIVRQSDAHAWAEVWLANQGWVRVDPTGAIAPERVQRGLSAAVSNTAALPFMARNPPQWMRKLRFNLDAISNQWNQWVIGYDTERQFAFLTRLGMESITWQKMAANLAGGLGLVIGLFSLFMLRHLITRQHDKVQASWLKLCRKMEHEGLPRAAHEGALDYAKRIASVRPDLSVDIRDLANRYIGLRYGMTSDEQAQREFIRRIAAFKT